MTTIPTGSIFVVKKGDNNANVIFETLTDFGQQFAMAQVFIPEISAGDKRILLINGEAVPYALARIPSDDDYRGNLVVGATGVGQIVELVTQLRGEAGKRQVEGARIALAENGGGFLGTEEAAMSIHILGKV